jgi:DNA-binding winged helix-turn-helix (wHTH) protein
MQSQQEEIILKHFESLYPEDARFSEIEKIFGFIKNGNSCQLISFPGTGRSNILNLLAYNHNVRTKHLGENQKYTHFVYMDFFEVKNRSLFEVNKFIFLSLADSLMDRGLKEEHDILHKIFKEHLELNDEMVLFQGLKEAVSYLALEKKFTIVLLFNKFEEYLPNLTDEFFANLRILRNKAKYRFSAIFSLDRPLEDSLDPLMFAQFYEFLAGNIVHVLPYDKSGIEFRASYFEKKYGKKIAKDTLDNLLFFTSGHARLMRVALETVFSQNLLNLKKEDLEKLLLSNLGLQRALLLIWNFLTFEERKSLISETKDNFLEELGLTKDGKIIIPLFKTYVLEKKENLKKEIKIEFNEEKNQIKKGEEVLSDRLTSYEFLLLKHLLQNSDRVIDREEIIKNVWKDSASVAGVTDQALDQLVLRLRKKIEENPNNPTHIVTVKGRGFKFSN